MTVASLPGDESSWSHLVLAQHISPSLHPRLRRKTQSSGWATSPNSYFSEFCSWTEKNVVLFGSATEKPPLKGECISLGKLSAWPGDMKRFSNATLFWRLMAAGRRCSHTVPKSGTAARHSGAGEGSQALLILGGQPWK